jgi:hypothetical protein
MNSVRGIRSSGMIRTEATIEVSGDGTTKPLAEDARNIDRSIFTDRVMASRADYLNKISPAREAFLQHSSSGGRLSGKSMGFGSSESRILYVRYNCIA